MTDIWVVLNMKNSFLTHLQPTRFSAQD